MTLLQLKYVVEVAAAGTISGAAKKLYIAQPSLTAAIKELEHEIGFSLFTRTNKGVVISPDGEEFLGYARQVIEQANLIEERYFGAVPQKRQFCVSTQHYSFAVEAFVDLILGVLTPQKGVIMTDGVDIQKGMRSWHDKIGYIPQTIYMLDDTIRNNIAFGANEDIDDERIWEALKQAQLDDLVREMEEGLDTVIGEAGVRLSGGQRQRIGIARALYRRPEVLVLDEATSALDNETEAAVMEAIDSLQGKMTMLIIAHRLSTIRNCNIVYKVENGSVTVDTQRHNQ